MNIPNSNLFNRVEAAQYIGVSPNTMNQWASSGRYKLKYFKIGRLIWYRKEDLDAFLEARGRIPGPAEPKPIVVSEDVKILSEALLSIHKIITEYSKLAAFNTVLTSSNVEKHAQIMQACFRHLSAAIKGDDATAEVWAHKVRLLTVGR